MVIRKSKLPLERMTPLDREAEIERRKAQEEERVEVLGQESDKKAIPWIQKDVQLQENREREYFFLTCELLKRCQNKKKTYLTVLSSILNHFINLEWIPPKYFVEIDASEQGIKVELKGTKYYGAFKPCFLPSYDFRYCQQLAQKTGNTIGKLEGYIRKSEGGIALPDEEDLKVYG